MRPPLNSLVAQLRMAAEAAREEQAGTLYAIEALRAAMLAAAGIGFDHATIRGPDGLNLNETKAADAAKTWLAGEKIEVEWKHRDGAGGVEAASSYDLVLTWKPAVKA